MTQPIEKRVEAAIREPSWYDSRGVPTCDRTWPKVDSSVLVELRETTGYFGRRVANAQWPFRRVRFTSDGFRSMAYANSPTALRGGGDFWFEFQLEYARRYFGSHTDIVYPEMYISDVSERAEHARAFVIQEMFSEINQPAVDLAVTLAELRETLSWVLGIFKRLFAVTKAFLKDPKALANAYAREIGAPSDSWLEYRYAIWPLVLEMQAYRDYFLGLTEFVPYVERTGASMLDERTLVDDWNCPWGSIRVTQKRSEQIKVYAQCSVDGLIDPAPLGTGAYDLVRASWEVVTLSFVVDWFVDIGQWLTSHRKLDTTLGKRSATYVVYSFLETSVSLGGKAGATHWIPCGPGVSADPIGWLFYVKDRIVGDDVFPPFTPLWNPFTLSWMRQLDALALITGALRSLIRSGNKKRVKRISRSPQ